jgi:hypothetical protein
MNAGPELARVTNGWVVRWEPTADTHRVALLRTVTDDGILQLEQIRTHHRGVSAVATDVCVCDLPDACREALRERGFTPAKVRDAGRRAVAACRRVVA